MAQCDAVLRDGVFRFTSLRNNVYGRMVLAAALTTIEKNTAESQLGGGVNLQIEGMPIGLGFDNDEYKAWQTEVKNTLNVETLLQRSTEILISSGDQAVLQAWQTCIAQSGGLDVHLEPLGDEQALLQVKWQSRSAADPHVALTDDAYIGGAIVQLAPGATNPLTKGTVLVNNNQVQVAVKRISRMAPIVVTVNTTLEGESAFLPAPIEVPSPPRSPYSSWESKNYPGKYMRHSNFLGYLGDVGNAAVAVNLQDATWRMRKGLAGIETISFQSYNYPGRYLRHFGFRIKLDEFAGTDIFREDASFIVKPGLADPNGVSFESLNYPGHFIRHRNFELWVDAFVDVQLYRDDATFYPKAALWKGE